MEPIRVELKASDVAACAGWLRRRKQRRVSRFLGFAVGGSFVLVIAASAQTLAGAIAAVAFVVSVVSFFLVSRSAMARSYVAGAAAGSGELVLDDAGVSLNGDRRLVKIAWPGIGEVVDAGDSLYLMSGERALVVPKRCVGDAQQVHRLFAFAVAHVSELQPLDPT